MARIAVGGFQHETNTFSAIPAAFADFEVPDAWPGLTRGGAMLEAVAGINLPASGFVQEVRSLHHELVPLTWCSAQPSGRVTRRVRTHQCLVARRPAAGRWYRRRPIDQPASCRPCTSAAMRACDFGSSGVVNMRTPTRRTRSCARATNGMAAAPPRRVMNWRRLMSALG